MVLMILMILMTLILNNCNNFDLTEFFMQFLFAKFFFGSRIFYVVQVIFLLLKNFFLAQEFFFFSSIYVERTRTKSAFLFLFYLFNSLLCGLIVW